MTRVKTWRRHQRTGVDQTDTNRFVHRYRCQSTSRPERESHAADVPRGRPSWKQLIVIGVGVGLLLLIPSLVHAQGLQDYDPLSRDNLSVSLKLLSILTLLTLAPSILLLTTAFPRIVIVLGFVRRALSTQEVPPNQVIIGLSIILTFFVMAPTFNAIKDDAIVPYLEGMPDGEALEVGVGHLRTFMWKHTDPDSIDVMISMSMDVEADVQEMTLDQVPLFTLVPAFVLSELKRAFEMGFMIYLPFVVIDLVVASTLISMGMLVLPPVLISLPFKILIFVLVDGWEVIVTQLIASF